VIAAIPAERLIFIDESGFHTRMTPLYACAPRGERAYGYVPRNHTHNTTLVAALSLAGVGDAMVIEGAMDGSGCVAWLEQGLGPTLVPGQVVVMAGALRAAQRAQGASHPRGDRGMRLCAALPAGLLAGPDADRGDVQ
jgi:DDE superfamily endonuclease